MKNLMKKIRKANKGFTLVELIIVVAIIAVLSAVAAPQYIKYVERSRQGVDASVLQEVKHIVEIEAATTEGLATSSSVIITVTKNASTGVVSGALTGTGSFLDSGANAPTAAFTNVQNTAGTLTFKSSNTVDVYTLTIDGNGVVAWNAASDLDIKALEKGTKVVGG